jgi:hypothetical protein
MFTATRVADRAIAAGEPERSPPAVWMPAHGLVRSGRTAIATCGSQPSVGRPPGVGRRRGPGLASCSTVSRTCVLMGKSSQGVRLCVLIRSMIQVTLSARARLTAASKDVDSAVGVADSERPEPSGGWSDPHAPRLHRDRPSRGRTSVGPGEGTPRPLEWLGAAGTAAARKPAGRSVTTHRGHGGLLAGSRHIPPSDRSPAGLRRGPPMPARALPSPGRVSC